MPGTYKKLAPSINIRILAAHFAYSTIKLLYFCFSILSHLKDIHKILKEHWGYDSFRPLQEDIIQNAITGNNTLVLLPTGGGKSLCFQVPTLAMEGICIVVSPLIALMKDQVENLKKRGVQAESVFSGMHYNEIDRILDNCIYGKIKFLYVSPERLRTELFLERLKKMKVCLLAIDEAHCISQWGYDFRPAYLNIAKIKEFLPEVPIIALTATATTRVKKDILEKLEIEEATVFQKSFERQNLSYSVLYEERKKEKLLDILKKVKGTGIVYVRSRKKTEDISAFLKNNNISADFYHGGLKTEERNKKQNDWIANKTRIIACTNAFGMGIDKPDVRIVVHLGLPESLEEYYQEAGRAGRDGQKSYAVLLHQAKDNDELTYRFEASMPKLEIIKQVYHALGSHLKIAIGSGFGQNYDLDMQDFAANYNLKPIHVFHSLLFLENEGYVQMTDGFYISSQLMFKVDRHELYNFQVKQESFNTLIKAILRNFEGVMDDFCRIDEKILSKVLARPYSEIVVQLKKMAEYNIVDYIPQKETPQITYLLPRLDRGNLKLDAERYLFRYQVKKKNIEAVIKYASGKSVCRSKKLLNYFDEKNAKTCGICDVCLGRNEKKIKVQELSKIEKLVEESIQQKSKTIDHLVKEFSTIQKEKIIETIRLLMDEGRLILDKNNNLLKWQK